MFKKIALGVGGALAVLLASLLVFATTKPDIFRVERSITLQAPPEKILPYLDNFHMWTNWSPYEKTDPAMKRTFSGPTEGKGAAYAWDGNDKAGAGHMEILETGPSRVTIKLDFLKPFEGHNTAEFTMQPQGGGTKVTWAMFGPNHYLSKVMQCVFDMDKLIGADFETGLSTLKTVTEK